MSVEAEGIVHIKRTIAADRRTVWNAWTRPEQMKRWSCPDPHGVREVVSDFRVGGSYTIRMSVDGQEHTAFGTYREIDEPRRLVYTWDWQEEDNAMGETLVTVEFEEVEGGTEVVLRHQGFPVEEARKGHGEGWRACLANFERLFR